ncbi:unnamed protein product, partial [Sphacelaria rigidula]
MEEDLALVLALFQEQEGLLAVRAKVRNEIVALQTEEDELRDMLHLPAAHPVSVPQSPSRKAHEYPVPSRPRKNGHSNAVRKSQATPVHNHRPEPPPGRQSTQSTRVEPVSAPVPSLSELPPSPSLIIG